MRGHAQNSDIVSYSHMIDRVVQERLKLSRLNHLSWGKYKIGNG